VPALTHRMAQATKPWVTFWKNIYPQCN